MSKRVVIGTHNKKKGIELAEMLAPYDVLVATLADFPTAIEVVEDGDSFAANARLKATQQALHLGEWVLADDSGIEIDALDGEPGIYSARFAGENATDEDNNRLLLAKLGDLPPERRGAGYYCHVTLADPTGEIRAESHATCRGVIRRAPSGSNGFGYDPLFEVREYHRTFGELGPAVKRALSHRSRAMRAIVPQLVALVSS
ncbi:non-canonical purine NTP pyrophosphatase [Aeoliella sp. SH292]|uniref:non-canonical purine NTP pyrophosphatase n=1 Tax=Aeoliella sp. SH292 TaxID=3454464 RepID=UPI003F971459